MKKVIKNEQPELVLHTQNRSAFSDVPRKETLERWMRRACERNTEMTVRFVDVDEGLELNSAYRHKQYATNVLTFNYTTEPEVSADIVICVPVVRREAEEQGKTFKEHLAHMLVHGTLHAHGYDHLNEEEAEVMEAKETQVMLSLKFPDPYSDKIGIVHD